MSTMLKRLLSLAVALVMVIGLMPWSAANVYAAEETTADTTWYVAEQSEFTIDTAAELLGLKELAKENNFAGKTVILGADISLAGIDWTPIGTSTVAFAGTFDGNNKTVSDMSLTIKGNGGFFAYLCGQVKDLTVSGSITSSAGAVGGIAGNIKSGASLSNVVSNVNITHTAGSNSGGVVGLILDKGTYTIENCSYNGTFTGAKSSGVGGILGNANGKGSTINITNCSVAGSISAVAQVGGLVGNTHNTNTIVISGSSNEAAITGTGNAVGGLIGTNGASALTIENCSNSGAVTGKATGAGGILGGFNAKGSVTVSGTTNTGAWYNANATTFTISSVDELLQFRDLVNAKNTFSGKTVNISTDLDLTNVAWTPIGLHVNAEGTAVGAAFAGTFNGNGHTISNLKAEPSGKAHSWGFFGQIAGTLKNFTVSGSIEGASNHTGGVTGMLRKGAKLENVTSNVDLTITGVNIGGLAGRVEQTDTYTISGCNYGGDINVTGNTVGGILGFVNIKATVNISNCTVSGDVIANGGHVGGILGSANNKESTFSITNCTIADGTQVSGTSNIGGIVGNAHNTNTLTISGTNNADVSGSNQAVGGIVGLLGDSTMTVSGSINNGDITAAEGHVAGIVGTMNSGAELTVTGCTNNGVIISGGNEFGGIVGTGRSTLTIEDSRNNGAVTAIQGNDSIYYGAIVGSLYGDSEEKPCVVTFGGEEGVTYLPTCSDQAYSLKVTEEGEAGSFVTVNGECTVYDPNPLGSETNPIIITEATELTSISVEAGKSIYYAINGQLNNCILSIASSENVTITLNGEEFSETAVLTGTPVNALVITNNSEQTITLAAEISYSGCTEHSWDEGVVTDPTCTKDGYTTYTCSACGQTRIDNVVSASGEHSYGDGEVTKAPTCSEDGEMTYTCSACGESYTEAIDATGEHSYDDSGVCTVCGVVVVKTWNIVLGDDIGLNFVLALAENDEVQVNVDDKAVPVELIDNGDGTYKVFIKVAAAQMTSEIQIVVNDQAVEKTYNVREYADVILAGDYSDEIKALVSNMLVYGGAAQSYFGVNTDDFAGENINVVDVTVPEDDQSVEIVDALDGVDCYGTTLVLRSKIAVRFYFTADSVEGLTFTVNGTEYNPVSNADGLHYVEVADINPQNLDDALTIAVSNGTDSLTVSYSPMSYISRMYHKAGSSEQLKAVVKTLYGYHLAAKAYIASK